MIKTYKLYTPNRNKNKMTRFNNFINGKWIKYQWIKKRRIILSINLLFIWKFFINNERKNE